MAFKEKDQSKHDKIIEALPAILEQVPDVVYLIVGTGREEERLRVYAQEKGVADRVIFAGHVPDEELPAYYNAADVFIMPNREEGTNVEGFGIVFLEANACGIPVIGGRSGGTVDAIADGLFGCRAHNAPMERGATIGDTGGSANPTGLCNPVGPGQVPGRNDAGVRRSCVDHLSSHHCCYIG